ncbi:MAG: [Fe-Fe] hydrogenase large subunit C-terminal domain-containing protein [Thermoanaerobaculales bacterium]
MVERTHCVLIDSAKCVGCVSCSQACPTRAIRVRDHLARANEELCIDCGACIDACRYDAVKARTSSAADLKRFKHTVAMPSLTLYAQFDKGVQPGQVLRALRHLGFDSTCDISWMCEMLTGATDAYLSECEGPWPKISVTCPAVVRLIQIRYPDLIPHLVPLETPRELAAKLRRRRLASELGLDPSEIGIFFITPCTAIIDSILAPEGLEASHLDGAFSIAELYGPLLRAIKSDPGADSADAISAKGLRWAMAGGEISSMRNSNAMTVRSLRDVVYVFDRIESGTFQTVDFIEAYICSGGCVGGQLTLAGRYVAQRNIRQLARQIGDSGKVKEEKVRSMLREHFFDIESEIHARPVRPLGRDLRQAIALKREKSALLERLPRKDCGACGAPDCDTLADDVVRGDGALDDCVFIKLEELERKRCDRRGGDHE